MYHSRRSSRSGDEHLYTSAIDMDLHPNVFDEEKNGASSSDECLPLPRSSALKLSSRKERPMSAKTKSILHVVLVIVGSFIGWTGNEYTRFLEAGESGSSSFGALNRT